MNAPVRTSPATNFLTPEALASYRDLAAWHEDQGRAGSAIAIRQLVFEIETLREAAKGSLVIVNQAVTEKNLTLLKASTLLIVSEKIAPVLDQEIEDRKGGCNDEDWAALQVLSDELHAAMRMVRA
jgi:hypothetical protein